MFLKKKFQLLLINEYGWEQICFYEFILMSNYQVSLDFINKTKLMKQISKNRLVLLLIILFCICWQSTPRQMYKKYLNTYDPKARCLDGTPPLFYVHQGKQPNKILLFVEGGAHCGGDSINQTLQNCYQRSKTRLGSSKYWDDQISGEGRGYLQLDPQKNRFAQWTKIILGYCDGSVHQGYRARPVSYKNTTLFFRGAAITRAQFNFLNQKYGLFKAQKLVFTGGSAGALMTFFWNSHLAKKLQDPSRMVVIPDSGIFLNTVSWKTRQSQIENKLMHLYKIANKDEQHPIKSCVAKHLKQGWKCFFFQNFYPFLKGRFLVINSQYDSYIIKNIMQQDCLRDGLYTKTLTSCSIKELFHIERYRKKYLNMINGFLQINPESSIWSIPCSQHVVASAKYLYDNESLAVPGHDHGVTIKQAVEKFVFDNERVINFDLVPWPYNWRCAY